MLDDRPYMRADYDPDRRRAPLAVVLLVINVAVFLLETAYVSGSLARLQFVASTFALSLDGLLHGYVWQLFTYQFMHGGLLHLVFNCVVLYFVGRNVEQLLGRSTFLLVYFGGGMVGGLVQALAGFIPAVGDVPVVGASGCLMALLGVVCWHFWNQRVQLLLMFVLPVTLTGRSMLVLLTIIDGVGIIWQQGNLAHYAHLGGLFAGFCFVRFGLQHRLPAFRLPSLRGRIRFQSSPADSRSQSRRASVTPAPGRPAAPGDFISREVDPILDKIAAHGIHSLTAQERAILEKAQKEISRR